MLANLLKDDNMARPAKPTEELKDQRVVIMFTKYELDLIDDWAFANRIRSRGEAIRRLCRTRLIKDKRMIEESQFKKAMDEAATQNVGEDDQ